MFGKQNTGKWAHVAEHLLASLPQLQIISVKSRGEHSRCAWTLDVPLCTSKLRADDSDSSYMRVRVSHKLISVSQVRGTNGRWPTMHCSTIEGRSVDKHSPVENSTVAAPCSSFSSLSLYFHSTFPTRTLKCHTSWRKMRLRERGQSSFTREQSKIYIITIPFIMFSFNTIWYAMN